MRRLLCLVLLVSGACTEQKSTKFSAPVAGAILSVDTGSPDAPVTLMSDVQSMLQTHPEWAQETLSHGAEPPRGYYFKFKGRCAKPPIVAVEVRRMLAKAVSGASRCEDVAG